MDLYTCAPMKKMTVLTSPPAATSHPIEHGLDYNPDTYFSQASTANFTITFDFGEAATVDQFALWIHDYDTQYGSGVQAIQVKSDDNDDGTFTSTTHLSTAGGIQFANTPGDPIYFPWSYTTPVKKRYWQIIIANSAAAVEISMFGFLRKRTISETTQMPRREETVYHTRMGDAANGRIFRQGINYLPQKIYHHDFLLSGTDWDSTALKQAFDDSQGMQYPMIVSDGSSTALVRFDDTTIDRNEIAYQVYKPRVTFEQVPYRADGASY